MDSLEYIDDYFKGELSPEEARQFDKRIKEDPLFAEEVAFYLMALSATKEEGSTEKKRNFRKLYANHRPEAPVRPLKGHKWIPALVAAALIGVVVSWFLFISPSSPPKLADRYIQENLEVLGVQMGATDSLQSGLSKYNEKKYSEALQQFENILRSDSSNTAALINAGITSLRMNLYGKALNYFHEVETHANIHANPALFYEALTLMKRDLPGDATRAKELLQDVVRNDRDKKEDAEQLLRKL
jgi:tetratricopeptide (TPR) repeat protein